MLYARSRHETIMEVRMVLSFIIIGIVISTSSCEADDPTPKPWPLQFHSQMILYTGDELTAIIDLWYDWPNGRNMNVIQYQLSYKLTSLEWNNGTSFYYSFDAGYCHTTDYHVGIVRPDFLDDSHYIGVLEMDGFTCNVWDKADFITYYEDVETKRPVGFYFWTADLRVHLITFEEGATLPDEDWQTPSLCFPTGNEEAQEPYDQSSLLLPKDANQNSMPYSQPWERWLLDLSK